ncbi:hypothetical protein BDZ91DRAFT_725261 [Kalaharituber pfeilii]|nr:hypothetical protein BDZ91DRAFT_725261 [Kalaharituber pfeilii]
MNEGLKPFFKIVTIPIPSSTFTVVSLSVSVSVSVSLLVTTTAAAAATTDTAKCPVPSIPLPKPPLHHHRHYHACHAPHALPTETLPSPAINVDARKLGGITLPEWQFWQVMVMVAVVVAIILGSFRVHWATSRNLRK